MASTSRERADVALAKALDLNPDLAESHFVRGLILWTKAKGFPHEQAVRSFKKALELEALAQLKTVPADVSPFLVDRVRAEVYVQLGRFDKARPVIDGFLAAHPDDEGGSLTGVWALMLAKAGDTREAKRMIARAIELGTGFGHFHHTAYNIAAAYAAGLDELRQCPRFVELMSALHRQWQHFRQMA